jgi:hypothetical protein
MFVVPLAFAIYAGTAQEAEAEAERFAGHHREITDTGYATAIGAPGDDSATGGSAVIELGGLVLRYVPDGTDLDRLLECLPHSTLPETVATVTDSLGEENPDVDENVVSITVPRAQAVAAAKWALDAPNGAVVQLELQGESLNVSQGDDGASFNTAGDEVPYRAHTVSEAPVAFPLSAEELTRQVEKAAVSGAPQITLTTTD